MCKQKWNLNFHWIFKKLRWRLLAICCTGALPLPLLFIFMILSHQKLTPFTLYFLTFQWKKGKQTNRKKTENSELRPSCLHCQVGWESAFHFALCAVKCCVNDFSFCSVDCWIIHNQLLWQPSRIQKQNSIDCYCCCCCQKKFACMRAATGGRGGGTGFTTWTYAQYARIAMHSFCCLYARLGSSSAEARATTATNN